VVWINEDKPEEGKTPNTGYRMTAARQAMVKAMQAKNPALILAANDAFNRSACTLWRRKPGRCFALNIERRLMLPQKLQCHRYFW
jgi:hypothetical protein